MSWYLEEAEKLEAEARKLRERHKSFEKAEIEIRIGVFIYDKEMRKVGQVSKLRNGSNDFEVNFLDGSVGRGYYYVVDNWRLATPQELENISIMGVSVCPKQMQKS